MTQDEIEEVMKYDKRDEMAGEESSFSESSGWGYDYKLDVLDNGQLCVRRYRSKKDNDTRCDT